ncbi:MAG: hypothetical protein LBO62_03805 [Endomicrobium sp.]|jgi:hypothetical protein|nr:hypothetical protein [Endomicrobium sp.]
MNISEKQNAKALPNSPTVWKAEELNQIIRELQNIITQYGIQPNGSDTTQVYQALQVLKNIAKQEAMNGAAQYTDAQIAQAISSVIHFVGYVSSSQPSGANFKVGDKWITASSMPSSFPVSNVKKWSGSAWVADNNYTPAVFDLWSLASDNHGYYWFGGGWNIVDFNVDLSKYQLRSEKNQPNGYCAIDNNGKLPASVIPNTEVNTNQQYIGEIKVIARKDVPVGLLRLDGAEYTRSAFPDFYDNYLLTSIIPTGTYTQWQTAYNANSGNVGFIGVDSANQKFKMPRLDDRVAIMQCLTIGNIGNYGRDQIVNITGDLYNNETSAAAMGVSRFLTIYENNSALYTSRTTGKPRHVGYEAGDEGWNHLLFDASRSVNTGDRVQPRHIQFPLMMVVANNFVPASQAQYSGFVDGLAGKLDKNGGNPASGISADVVIQWATGLSATGYADGWYRKYKSGWVEQGATITKTVGANANQTFPLIVPMASNKYYLNVFANIASIDNTVDTACVSKSSSDFVLRFAWSSTGNTLNWEIKGMQ